MKDVYSVLREKHRDLERIRQEVEALVFVIPLLQDDQSTSDNDLASVVPLQTTEPPPKPPQREPFSKLLTSWLSESKA